MKKNSDLSQTSRECPDSFGLSANALLMFAFVVRGSSRPETITITLTLSMKMITTISATVAMNDVTTNEDDIADHKKKGI